MEQAQKVKDPEQAGAWDDELAVAEIKAVVLPLARVGPAFAQAVEQRSPTK